jgi:hypothetical protein
MSLPARQRLDGLARSNYHSRYQYAAIRAWPQTRHWVQANEAASLPHRVLNSPAASSLTRALTLGARSCTECSARSPRASRRVEPASARFFDGYSTDSTNA